MRSIPLETIGALLGHKDPKMTKRYAHLSLTTLQDLQNGNKAGTSAEAGTSTGLSLIEKVVPPGRVELPTQGLGIPCSIRLSYGGNIIFQ
jgi:hypothetical protein